MLNKNESESGISVILFLSQDLLAYPPNICPSVDSIIEIVGPLLSHFLWNISFVSPSVVPFIIV